MDFLKNLCFQTQTQINGSTLDQIEKTLDTQHLSSEDIQRLIVLFQRHIDENKHRGKSGLIYTPTVDTQDILIHEFIARDFQVSLLLEGKRAIDVVVPYRPPQRAIITAILFIARDFQVSLLLEGKRAIDVVVPYRPPQRAIITAILVIDHKMCCHQKGGSVSIEEGGVGATHVDIRFVSEELLGISYEVGNKENLIRATIRSTHLMSNISKNALKDVFKHIETGSSVAKNRAIKMTTMFDDFESLYTNLEDLKLIRFDWLPIAPLASEDIYMKS
ncbi:unnamed protein product [Oppiella nova]|uniref:Uncharacterized protein n=1 Tax=Oppiella nova TaxID=334625 RepID=A0A7R9QGI5_9ACAR|nr:unnamed protein product [Oppiella nova]CAG2165463.1 unnamed protein product [Oppiella nova]